MTIRKALAFQAQSLEDADLEEVGDDVWTEYARRAVHCICGRRDRDVRVVFIDRLADAVRTWALHVHVVRLVCACGGQRRVRTEHV
jgi:hypothetical protein